MSPDKYPFARFNKETIYTCHSVRSQFCVTSVLNTSNPGDLANTFLQTAAPPAGQVAGSPGTALLSPGLLPPQKSLDGTYTLPEVGSKAPRAQLSACQHQLIYSLLQEGGPDVIELKGNYLFSH